MAVCQRDREMHKATTTGRYTPHGAILFRTVLDLVRIHTPNKNWKYATRYINAFIQENVHSINHIYCANITLDVLYLLTFDFYFKLSP